MTTSCSGFAYTRRSEQHRVDDAEHRGVERDADRQRERGDDREHAIAQQGSRADARVHPGLLEELSHPPILGGVRASRKERFV